MQVQKKKFIFMYCICDSCPVKFQSVVQKIVCKNEKCQTTSHSTIRKNVANGNLTHCKPKKAK